MKFYKSEIIPLISIIIYVLFGVSLSMWGPIDFIDYHKFFLLLYILGFLLFFTIGYLFGLKHDGANFLYNYSSRKKNIFFYVKFNIWIIVMAQIYGLYTLISTGGLNLDVTSMGEVYVNYYSSYVRGTGKIRILFLIQTLAYVSYIVTLVLGAYYYKSLPKIYKFTSNIFLSIKSNN